MRLINADELSRDIRIQLSSCDGDYERALLNIALKVNYSKGIKAIPVEWIKKYINKIGASNGIMNMHREHLKTLIKDWEEEND